MFEPSGIPASAIGVAGDRPALLLAPHGGRRPDGSELGCEPGRKVNDLHTAEITLELARRTGAAAIVNRTEDRNRLDWNRVSDVRARAGWLLDLLLAAVHAQIAVSGRATLLFVHGWNAIQPSCDVGIGARIRAGTLVPVKQGFPTIPVDFLPRLASFAETCRRHGIGVTIGHRYPAAGRDNMMQIFTPRFAEDTDPRIYELARLGGAGKIAAVQLELGVPLRWSGPYREGIIDGMAALVRGDAGHGRLDLIESSRHPEVLADHLALEFHDGRAGVGGFAAIEQATNGDRQGRMLLCVGSRRLALFTGEDRGHTPTPLRCVGLAWERGDAGSAKLAFRGPCLSFPRTDPFLDLERGLSEASLDELEVELRWAPLEGGSVGDAPALVGRIEGHICLGGFTAPIDAFAALRHGAAAAKPPWRERSAFNMPLGEDTCLSVRSRSAGGERVAGVVSRAGRAEPLLSGTITCRAAADGLLPEAWRIEAVSRSGTWRVLGRVTHSIPVVRPGPDGRILTVFGLARFVSDDRVGFGTFEQSQRLDQKGVPS